ncbi:acyl-CoA desaturase [Flavobacteriaceae bacterium]|nr:acyl-CoA desaturase [Flavobacteriaceae bacterium]
MTSKQSLRFSREDPKKFFKTLNTRVNNYFKEKQIRKTGNWKLYLKTLIMFSILFTPYFLFYFIDFSLWIKFFMCVMMGIGMAGVGMNVMHDGNHGSYSRHKWVNKIMGGSIYILAGNVFNWKVQHNILHHTYTNIHGHDEDIDTGGILRFSQFSKWFPYHRFQQFYFIFLYGFLTLKWAVYDDFNQLKNYTSRNITYTDSKSPNMQWIGLIISKISYFLFWLILPIIFLKIKWWSIMIGFILMHYTAGLILSLVFQLAHVMEDSKMFKAHKTGTMRNTWALHQLVTTVNFSTKNRLVNWFTGGLNHQIEHHFFPHISHIHYSKIGPIVKKTTAEFNLPYNEHKTTRSALFSHFKFLKKMGAKNL